MPEDRRDGRIIYAAGTRKNDEDAEPCGRSEERQDVPIEKM
jgi:hypothetical protein